MKADILGGKSCGSASDECNSLTKWGRLPNTWKFPWPRDPDPKVGEWIQWWIQKNSTAQKPLSSDCQLQEFYEWYLDNYDQAEVVSTGRRTGPRSWDGRWRLQIPRGSLTPRASRSVEQREPPPGVHPSAGQPAPSSPLASGHSP